MARPYYMVHAQDSAAQNWTKNDRTPHKEHLIWADALAEAKRLARENPGIEFVVLGSLSTVCTCSDVVVSSCRVPTMMTGQPLDAAPAAG